MDVRNETEPLAEEVRRKLRRAGRRMGAVRAGNEALTGAALGAVSACCLLAGAWASLAWPVGGVLLAAGPAVVGAAGLPVRRAGRRRPGRKGRFSALGRHAPWLMVSGLLAGLAVAAAWPPRVAAAGLILLGAMRGWGVLGGSWAQRAAERLDRRAGLRDALTTAAEWVDRPGADGSVRRAVLTEALQAWRIRKVDRVPLGDRSPRRVPAAGLAVLAAVALGLLLPDEATSSWSARAERRAQMRLADRVERVASTLQAPPEQIRQWLELARAIRVADEAEARRWIAELRRRGYRPLAGVDPGALARAGLGSGSEGGGPASATEPDASGPRSRPRPSRPGEAEVGEGLSAVYDPAPSDAPAADADGVGAYRPLADAWARARRAAEASMASGGVPPAYREIVRRYYAGPPAEESPQGPR